MLFPLSCKYLIIWLCHPSLFQKTELLLRDQIFSFGRREGDVQVTCTLSGNRVYAD
jgi:hypothetical protein